MAGLNNWALKKYKTEDIAIKTLTGQLEDHFKARFVVSDDNHLGFFDQLWHQSFSLDLFWGPIMG